MFRPMPIKCRKYGFHDAYMKMHFWIAINSDLLDDYNFYRFVVSFSLSVYLAEMSISPIAFTVNFFQPTKIHFHHVDAFLHALWMTNHEPQRCSPQFFHHTTHFGGTATFGVAPQSKSKEEKKKKKKKTVFNRLDLHIQ